MEFLTVLIPTLGERSSLERAEQSVRDQTVPVRLIVERDPGRTGCGPTLNRAVKSAETPWVSTLGDDDVLDRRFAEMIHNEVLLDDNLDMVIVQMRYPNGVKLPQVRHPQDLVHGGVGASYAVRTELAREIGWIDEPSRPFYNEDWEMISAVRSRGGKIRIVPKVGYYIRHDGNS